VCGVERDVFLEAIRAEGIPFGKAYGYPLYRNPSFSKKYLKMIYPENILKLLPDYENMHLEKKISVVYRLLWVITFSFPQNINSRR